MTPRRSYAVRRILSLSAHLTDEERVDVARELLPPSEGVTAGHEIARAWCRANGTTVAEMQAWARSPLLVRKRRELYAHMSLAGFSSVEIGRVMKRDHSTVLHGLKAGLKKCG